MKTQTMGIKELAKARLALNDLLSCPGIPRKKVYLLDRNRDHIVSAIKKWELVSKNIFEKHCVDLPKQPFVPYNSYQSFKKEIIVTTLDPLGIPTIEDICIKYEKIVDGNFTKGIPVEKESLYKKELDAAVENFKAEVEFFEIESDPITEEVLRQIAGEAQLAISYMIQEEGLVKIFPGLQS